MKRQATRPYNAPLRQARAEATRRAILEAARLLFARLGYRATTIRMMARKAHVAIPTVYVTFGSKAAILSALVSSVGAADDIRELARVAFAEADPARRLRKAARVFRTIHEREADIEDLLWQAGGGDPDLAAVWRQSHRQQLSRQRELMTAIAQVGGLRTGTSLNAATQTLWALSSPEVYRLLVREQGWTSERYEGWLADSAIRLLLSAS